MDPRDEQKHEVKEVGSDAESDVEVDLIVLTNEYNNIITAQYHNLVELSSDQNAEHYWQVLTKFLHYIETAPEVESVQEAITNLDVLYELTQKLERKIIEAAKIKHQEILMSIVQLSTYKVPNETINLCLLNLEHLYALSGVKKDYSEFCDYGSRLSNIVDLFKNRKAIEDKKEVKVSQVSQALFVHLPPSSNQEEKKQPAPAMNPAEEQARKSPLSRGGKPG